MKYFFHLNKQGDCWKCQNQCPRIQQGLLREVAGPHSASAVVVLLYYKTLHNKQLPCLSTSKVEMFFSKKEKVWADILILSFFSPISHEQSHYHPHISPSFFNEM